MDRSRPRTPATLSESIHRQLNTYALAATAAGVSSLSFGQPTEGKSESLHCRLRPSALAATAVGLLGLVQLAEGKIVYTPANSQVQSQLRIDLNHDGVTDFYIFSSHTLGNSLSITPRQANETAEQWSKGHICAAALKEGVTVGPESRFRRKRFGLFLLRMTNLGYTSFGPWRHLDGQRYLGLKFVVDGKTHYAWARLKIDKEFYTLTGYAYETIPNKPIITGATKGTDDIPEGPDADLTMPSPEPASLGALALGAPGLSIWRREEESIGL